MLGVEFLKSVNKLLAKILIMISANFPVIEVNFAKVVRYQALPKSLARVASIIFFVY